MPIALVTGANGFVGSHFVRLLIERGYTVRCLVRYTGDISSLRELSVPLYLGDLREPETLIEPVKGVDYIFHLAAEVSAVSEQDFLDANTTGTEHLLIAAEHHAKNTLKRFLFVSTQAAVGSGDDATPYDENKDPVPTTWYGKSKKRAEEIVRSYADRIPVTIVRPSVVYGEREEDLLSLFPVIEKRIFPRVGFTKKYSVFIYVGDLVDGIVGAAESQATIGNTYFLTHPEPLTAGTIVREIGRSLGKQFGIMIPTPLFMMHLMGPLMEILHHFTRSRPMLTRDKARLFSERYWVASPQRAKDDFGWEAKHALPDGMPKMAKYYKDQKEKLRSMSLESRGILWMKYFILAILIGFAYVSALYIGDKESFPSGWFVLPLAAGWYGVVLGSLGLRLRMRDGLLQFLAGWAISALLELVNYLFLDLWDYTPSWLAELSLHISINAAVLGIAGGVFVLVINWCMRNLYKRRLRYG